MADKKDIQAQLGKKIIEGLRIDYDKLSTEEDIDLKVQDIIDNLSVLYYKDEKAPDYDERVTN